MKIEYKDMLEGDYYQRLYTPEIKNGAFRIFYRNGGIGYKLGIHWHKEDGPAYSHKISGHDWFIEDAHLSETQFLKTSLVGKELLSEE